MHSKLISQLSIDYAKAEPLMKDCFNVAKAELDLSKFLSELMAASSQFVLPDHIQELENQHRKLNVGKTSSLSNEDADKRIQEALKYEI